MYFTREAQTAPEEFDTTRNGGATATAAAEQASEYDPGVLGRVFSGAPGEASSNGANRLLRSPALSSKSNNGIRVIALSRAQQTHGNRYTQRLVSQIQLNSKRSRVVQRECACGGTCSTCTSAATEGVAAVPIALEESSIVQRQTAGASPPNDGNGANGGGVIPTDSFGRPLDESTRRLMEERIGADFGDVRVHTDQRAAASAQALDANAYTTGRDIYFAPGKYAPEIQEGQHLLAHELTHTLQQAEGEAVATSRAGDVMVGDAADPLEREAERVADTVGSGHDREQKISPDVARPVRRDVTAADVWNATGGRVVSAGGELAGEAWEGAKATGRKVAKVAGDVWDEAKETAAAFIDRIAPGVLPLLRGAGTFIYEKITAGADGLFGGIASRVQKQGVVGAITGILTEIAGSVGKAVGELAAGQCSAIVSAATTIGQFVKAVASDVFADLGKIAKTVGDFFTDLWNDFGKPALEAIQKVAGAAWTWIKEKADWVWQKLEPIRTKAEAAWNWIKRQFNIAKDEANGLLDRFHDWAKEQWMKIRDKIEPILGPLKIVAGVLLLLSPLGPIIAIWKGGPYLWKALQWIAANGIKPVTERIRADFREHILPQILAGIDAITVKLDEASQFLCDNAGKISSGLQSLEDGLNGIPFLSLAARAVGVVRGFFDKLAAKGKCKFSDVIAEVKAVLRRIHQFLKPILELLRQAALVAAFGVWAILDDGVWGTLNSMVAFAKKTPCIREIAGLLHVDGVMAKVGEFRLFLKDLLEIVTNQEKFEKAIHDALDGMLAQIPSQAQTVLGTIAGLDGPHLDTLARRFLAPKIAEVIARAPSLLIEMAWSLVWPIPGVVKEFEEIEKDADKLKQSLWDFKFSKAVDAGLAIWRGANGILGLLYGWFFLAAVIVGAIFASPQAGAAVAYEVGEVLLISTLLAEAASIEKAKINLMSSERLAKPEQEREEEDKEDYQLISGSIVNLAIIGALVILGEVAVSFAKAVFAEIKAVFLPEGAKPPKVEIPARPGEPPVRPGEPPVRPAEPPVRPGEPPARPAEPARPGEPARPAEPAEPARPAEPAEPARPAEPAEPARPGEPAEPARLGEPAEPARPAEPAEPARPGEPAEKPTETPERGPNDEPVQEPEPKPGEKDVDPAICFPAGTLISTTEGRRPIESVGVGALVCAFDFTSGEVVTRQVVKVTRGLTTCWVDVQTESDVLRATRSHPIWVESEQNWISAEELKPGMTLITRSGQPIEVTDVRVLPQRDEQETYNLSVEEVANFFAGFSEILVHNITPSRIAHLSRPGYRNYHLRAGGPNGPIYYTGMYGPGSTPADVQYRHRNNHNRFNPDPLPDGSPGDYFDLQPGSREYGEARLKELRDAVQHETINKNAGEDYRCNRQDPLAADKVPEYTEYELYKQGCG